VTPEWLDAELVKVTFRIANWGIPGFGKWDPVNRGNPAAATSTPATVDKASGPDSPGVGVHGIEWVLTAEEVAEYDADVFTVEPGGQTVNHQCILVEIDSDSDVDVVTQSVTKNMRFSETSSPFSHQAIISSFGYDLRPGQTEQQFLLRVRTRVLEPEPERKLTNLDLMARDLSGNYAPVPPSGDDTDRTSRVEYIVKGYRITGGTVTLDGTSTAMAVPIGSYGYIVSHDGPVDGWEFSLEGPGVEPLDDQTYLITIPAETKVVVWDTITPIEPPKWRVQLAGGVALPVTGFASLGAGPNALAGVGYFLTDAISIHGVFGFNRLLGDGTAGDLMHASAVARFWRPIDTDLSVFAGVGAGYYFGDALAAGEDGGNLGAGITWSPSRVLELELGVDHHYLRASGAQFSHIHAGLSFRF
jgi:hypothetical protein